MGCRLSGPWMGDGMGVRGGDLSHTQKREAFRFLASYEQPITLQMEGGRSLRYNRTTDCSTQTDPLRYSSNIPRIPHADRMYYGHMTLPGNHRDGGRYEFLPNTSRELQHRERLSCNDPEFSSGTSPGQSCLLGCCNTSLEEPRSFQSQTDDEEYLTERPLGYLPLHHELDSGLGWTDGSFHQGELSGVETEPEECRGRSPSSESFVSSEPSDSGFYSVSTGEFLRFQRLLEKRMRHHHKHRELEAIPETVQDAEPRGLSRMRSVQNRKTERPCLSRHSASSGSLFSPTCSTPSGQRRALVPPSCGGMLRRSRTLHHRHAPAENRRRASHPASPNYCSATLHHCGRMGLPQEPNRSVGHPLAHGSHAASQPSLISPVDAPPPDRTRAATEPHLELVPNRQHHLEQVPNRQHHLEQVPNRQHHLEHLELVPNRQHHLEQVPNCQHHLDHQELVPNRQHHLEHLELVPNRQPHLEHQELVPNRQHHLEHLELVPNRQHHMELVPNRQPHLDHQELVPNRQHHQELVPNRQHHLDQASNRQRRFHTLSHTPSQDANDTWPKPANRSGAGGGLYSTLEGHAPTQKPPGANVRTLRNQMLRDRASRLADERSGMSTDEESEVRMGRYWSRTERREHVLQKQRLLQARGGGAARGASADGYSAVLELSQRKLSRLRNRKLLDDWTTVEELLTHGTRLGEGTRGQLPASLLTVTTV